MALSASAKIGVKVTTINSKLGVQTYLSKKNDDQVLLIPYISFYANHQTETGNYLLLSAQPENLKPKF